MNIESIPGCFGYYPKALEPNECRRCGLRKLCEVIVIKSLTDPQRSLKLGPFCVQKREGVHHGRSEG